MWERKLSRHHYKNLTWPQAGGHISNLKCCGCHVMLSAKLAWLSAPPWAPSQNGPVEQTLANFYCELKINQFPANKTPAPYRLPAAKGESMREALWLKGLLSHWQISFCGPCLHHTGHRASRSATNLTAATGSHLLLCRDYQWRCERQCLISGVRAMDWLGRLCSLPGLWQTCVRKKWLIKTDEQVYSLSPLGQYLPSG